MYEKQTWNTGDVITAQKLNHMEDGIAQGGTSYDLVLTETVPAEGNPTLTGSGLSIEELKSKIESGDAVAVKYTNIAPLITTCTVCTYGKVEHTYQSDDYMIYVQSSRDGNTEFLYNFASGGTNNLVFIDGYNYYTFTYDSSSKEYTFTFDHNAD